MTISMGKSEKKPPSKEDKKDDSGMSKNHSKSVKFRLRVQEQREAAEEIKEYGDKGNPRVY